MVSQGSACLRRPTGFHSSLYHFVALSHLGNDRASVRLSFFLCTMGVILVPAEEYEQQRQERDRARGCSHLTASGPVARAGPRSPHQAAREGSTLCRRPTSGSETEGSAQTSPDPASVSLASELGLSPRWVGYYVYLNP